MFIFYGCTDVVHQDESVVLSILFGTEKKGKQRDQNQSRSCIRKVNTVNDAV